MGIEWQTVDNASHSKFTVHIEPFTLDVSRNDDGKLYSVLRRGVTFVTMTGAIYTDESAAKNAAIALLKTHVLLEKRILADVEQHLILAGYLAGS